MEKVFKGRRKEKKSSFVLKVKVYKKVMTWYCDIDILKQNNNMLSKFNIYKKKPY